MLLLTTVCLFTAAAPAPQPVPERVLVVVPEDATAERIRTLYAGLSAAGVVVVGPDERRGVNEAVATLPVASIDEVKAANLEARGKWRTLDLPGARAALDRAEEAFFRLGSPRDAFSELGQTLLLRAEIALTRQDAATATRELRLLARLESHRTELNAGLYAPALVDAYAAARAANADAAAGLLTLTPRSAQGALVSATIDTKPVAEVAAGVTSSLRSATGPHLVVVTAPGRQTFAVRVDVTVEVPVVLAPFLAVPFAEQQRTTLTEQVRSGDVDALLPLAKKTGASAVLGVGIGDRNAAWLWTRTQKVDIEVASTADPVVVGRAVRTALDVNNGVVIGTGDEADPVFVWTLAGAAVFTGAVVLTGVAVGLSIYTYQRGFPFVEQKKVTRIPLPVVISCCSL